MYIPINQIEVDESIYPRNQMDWLIAYQYQKAMEAGANFPPMLLGKRSKFSMETGKDRKQYVVIDGAHRLSAWGKTGKDKVPAIISTRPEKEWLLESVEINSKNGKVLSVQEKLQNAVRLQEQGFKDDVISAAVFIPITELNRLIQDRAIVRSVDKSAMVSKAPIVLHKEAISSQEQQRVFHSGSQVAILKEVVQLFKIQAIEENNEEVLELIKELNQLTEKFLENIKVPA